MRRTRRLIFTLVLLPVVILIAGPGRAFAACGSYNQNLRAWDFSTATDSTGVQGLIHIPDKDAISGWGDGAPSAGDVFIDFSGGGFVQMGWYVGSTSSGLDNVTTPHIFYGENTGGNHVEVLHDAQSAVWGGGGTAQIVGVGGGSFRFYYDGDYIGQTQMTHMDSGVAAFTGEVDFVGTRMWASAYANQSPLHTLQRRDSSKNWAYFTSDTRGEYDSVHFSSTSAGDNATDSAIGGGPADCP